MTSSDILHKDVDQLQSVVFTFCYSEHFGEYDDMLLTCNH